MMDIVHKSRRRWFFAWSVLLLAALALLSGCSSSESRMGCDTDADCRSNRICHQGTCTFPELVEEPAPSQNNSSRPGTPNDFDDVGVDDASSPYNPNNPNNPSTDVGVDIDATSPSDDPDSPGTEEPPPPIGPRLALSPVDAIVFGLVPVGMSVSADLSLTNKGDRPLTLTQLSLATTPSQGFSLHPEFTPDTPATLEPGETIIVEVHFSPGSMHTFRNSIVIESDDVLRSSHSLDVRGQAFERMPQPCFTVSPPELNFGILSPAETRDLSVTLINCGTSQAVNVSTISLRDEPNTKFEYHLDDALPWTLEVGETKNMKVTFSPDDYGDQSDVLRFLSSAATTLNARVALNASGGSCAQAVAMAQNLDDSNDLHRQGRIPIPLGNVAQLSGDASISDSAMLEYHWKLTQKPQGSQAFVDAPNSNQPTLTPDKAGAYVVELSVIDRASGRDGCVRDSVEIIALPAQPALYVSTQWQAPHDMDLHLLRSDTDGNFPAIGDSTNDAHYENPSPNWYELDDPTDDAFHLGDRTGPGPEAILLGALEPGRRYRVGVRFTMPNDFQPLNWDVSANLKVNQTEFTLNKEFFIHQLNTVWIPFEIDGTTGEVTELDQVQ